MTYTEGPPEHTVPAVVAERLRDLAPETEWDYSAELLFPGPTMASRARTLLDRYKPDAVVLWLTAVPFGEDSVVYAVRDRWPRLYAP
ncbi:MAG TPA: hypothetical protein VH951_04855, partial [Dehalococcoidia bacterium]